ncbi:hypothetical protein [Falsiroseomonas sp. CW058]|uniref:hypothetical protein n=1 Tax=Falsiroseomonas sp. CW058 TaxID=3388664 RepID=UPI003D317BC8
MPNDQPVQIGTGFSPIREGVLEAEIRRLRAALADIADAPMSSKEDLVRHAKRALAPLTGG